MTRILVVDDHAVVRQGLKQILDGAVDGAVFGEAASGEEAVGMVAAADWDAVILDISLPGKSGLEALKELRRARPRLPVLVLSMYPEEQFAVRALRAGAAGYLAKKTTAADLKPDPKTSGSIVFAAKFAGCLTVRGNWSQVQRPRCCCARGAFNTGLLFPRGLLFYDDNPEVERI